MKNIITVITIILFFTSCGNEKKSATENVGDVNEYIKKEENKVAILESTKETNKYVEASDDDVYDVEYIMSEGGPEIEFSNVVWDFGKIKQQESVDHVFTFINTGSEPLIISNAKGSCGCTVPKWPKEPIPPNGVGEIAVQFNSGEKKGKQNKTVTLTTNCTPNTTILRVVGNILTN